MPGRTVEVVNLRLQAVGLVEKPALTLERLVENDGADARLGQKPVCLRSSGQAAHAVDASQSPRRFSAGETGSMDSTVGQVDLYDRARLRPGARFTGPALLFQMDSTVFVPPGWFARVDGYRNLVLEHSE